MATINKIKIKPETTPVAFSFTAGDTTSTLLDYTGEDQKTLVIFNNTADSAGTAIIKAGTGLQGGTDITVAVAAGFSAMVLESGSFKQMNGDNKGMVNIVPSAATITVALVELR